MNDLNNEQRDLLRRALGNFAAHGIPADATIAGSGAAARDQRVVRDRIERMSAGMQG